jgi:NAD(P)-dependent dehydrogenase (short-subunit alcohol dehydrogenase family)
VSDGAPLAGRVALVTGAGRGIGRAIAARLAAEGASVGLLGRSANALAATSAEIAEAGGRSVPVLADVRSEEQLESAVAELREAFGPADVLVANSGVAGPTGQLWQISKDEWGETLAVNLTGVFLSCRAAIPGMLERRRGSIVVIGSATGKRPMAGRTPYAASKMGLIGLVRTLALELGPHDVRVNLVSPGPTEGERLDEVIAGRVAADGGSSERIRERMLAGIPLGRMTRAADVAAAVAFLAGDASAAISGEDLNVSMGWVMH